MDCTFRNATALVKDVRQLAVTRQVCCLDSRTCSFKYTAFRRDLVLALLINMSRNLLIRYEDGGHSWVYLPVVAFFHNLTGSEKDLDRCKEMLQLLSKSGEDFKLGREATVGLSYAISFSAVQ